MAAVKQSEKITLLQLEKPLQAQQTYKLQALPSLAANKQLANETD